MSADARPDTAPDTAPTRHHVATAAVLLPGIAMVAVTFGLARYGYGLLLPDMRAELGISPSAAGLISALGYLSYLVANAGVVPLTSRHGPRVAVAGAAAAAAVGMAVIAVAGGVVTVLLGVVVAGAAAGMAFPPYADVVDRHVDARRRGVVWSAISSGTGWGVALAGPVAIVAGDRWRWAWAAFVLVAVVVGVAATALAPAHEERALRRPQLSPSWFFCPRSRPLLLSAVLIGLGSAVWWVFSVEAMQEGGLPAAQSMVVYAVCGTACLLGSLSGFVFDRLGLRAGYLGSAALLAAAPGILAAGAGELAAALVAATLFGAAYAAVIAAHGVWSAQVFAQHPAAGLAAVSTALTIGILLGSAAAGVLVGHGGHPLALGVAAAVTAAALPFCPPGTARRAALADHHCTAAPVRP